MDGFVKIAIEVPIEGTDNIEVETVWAVPQGEGFKLENIPFGLR